MMLHLSSPGISSCAGSTVEELYRNAVAGYQAGIVPYRLSSCYEGNYSGEKMYRAGMVDIAALPSLHGHYNTKLIRMAHCALLQIQASIEWAQALYGPARVALICGTCNNGAEWSEGAHSFFFEHGAFPAPYRLSMQAAQSVSDYAAAAFGIAGPVLTTACACASSASAVIRAAQLIKAGICDAVVAGGADIVCDTVMLGFAALESVSHTISNPFSKNRDGITIGDGAAFFVVSRDAIGVPSNKYKNMLLAGYGESADAYHITSPRPDGAGALCAMRRALHAAHIGPEDIAYINLHGTGTQQNDAMEAASLHALFGERRPLVSSTKPVTGHTLGAAGALELAICTELLYNGAMNDGRVPVHCWDGVFDDGMPRLHFAERDAALKNPQFLMSNSFAFGGCNTSLIVREGGDIHGE
jgi:3-oxoacyl-[acyl-carrier-protein] synthase-1